MSQRPKAKSMKVFGVRLIGALALSAAAAFGATNACPPSNGSGLPASGAVVDNNVSSPGFPGGPGPAGTCTAVDLTFSNFAVINLVNRLYVYGGGGAGNNPVANPLFLTFATERGTATGVDTSNDDGVNNFTNKVTTPFVVGFQDTANVISGTDKIDQLKISVGGLVINGSANLQVIACENVSISGNFTAGQCTTAGGTVVTQTLDLSTATSLTLALTPTTVVSINNKVTLVGLGGGGTNNASSFLTMTNEFDQITAPIGTPEPATFAMLGSALVGLGFLRHRRGKT